MPRTPNRYWEIYESQLLGVVNGTPLWNPSPHEENGQWTHLELGDVGHMLDGRFATLFNVARPSTLVDAELYPGEKIRDAFCKKSTTDSYASTSVAVAVQGTRLGSSFDVENHQLTACLACTGEAGAALILPGPEHSVKMESFDLRHAPYYADYCFRNCEKWLKSDAVASASKLVDLKDLVFVTGIDKVQSWSLFAFQQQLKSCQFSIVAGPSSASGSPVIQSSETIEHAPFTNFGPISRKLHDQTNLNDQCVVIRRFKMHRRIDRMKWKMSKYISNDRLKLSTQSRLVSDSIVSGPLAPTRTEEIGVTGENKDDGDVEAESPRQESSEKITRKDKLRGRAAPPSPEGSSKKTDRKDGDPGPGGAGGSGTSSGGSSSTGNWYPPGNSGGSQNRSRSGGTGNDGGNGRGSGGENIGGGRMMTFEGFHFDAVGGDTESAIGLSDGSSPYDDESVDLEPLEPLDVLLEYILDACPDADYSCASDSDLEPFREYLSDWVSFPEILKEKQPRIHLMSNGMASLSMCSSSAPLGVCLPATASRYDYVTPSQPSALVAPLQSSQVQSTFSYTIQECNQVENRETLPRIIDNATAIMTIPPPAVQQLTQTLQTEVQDEHSPARDSRAIRDGRRQIHDETRLLPSMTDRLLTSSPVPDAIPASSSSELRLSSPNLIARSYSYILSKLKRYTDNRGSVSSDVHPPPLNPIARSLYPSSYLSSLPEPYTDNRGSASSGLLPPSPNPISRSSYPSLYASSKFGHYPDNRGSASSDLLLPSPNPISRALYHPASSETAYDTNNPGSVLSAKSSRMSKVSLESDVTMSNDFMAPSGASTSRGDGSIDPFIRPPIYETDSRGGGKGLGQQSSGPSSARSTALTPLPELPDPPPYERNPS